MGLIDRIQNPRRQGLVCLVIGVVGGGAYYGYLLASALQRVPKLWGFYRLGVMLPIFLVVYGGLLLVLGDKAKKMFAIDRQNLTRGNVVLLLVAAGLGLAWYIGFIAVLRNLGYESDRW